MNDNFKPGSLGFHELVHLTYVFADNFEQHIINHDAVEENMEIKILAESILSQMYNLYSKCVLVESEQ